MNSHPENNPQTPVGDEFPSVEGIPSSREHQWRLVIATPALPLEPEIDLGSEGEKAAAGEEPWPVALRTLLVLMLILVFLFSWQQSVTAS